MNSIIKLAMLLLAILSGALLASAQTKPNPKDSDLITVPGVAVAREPDGRLSELSRDAFRDLSYPERQRRLADLTTICKTLPSNPGAADKCVMQCEAALNQAESEGANSLNSWSYSCIGAYDNFAIFHNRIFIIPGEPGRLDSVYKPPGAVGDDYLDVADTMELLRRSKGLAQTCAEYDGPNARRAHSAQCGGMCSSVGIALDNGHTEVQLQKAKQACLYGYNDFVRHR